MPPKKKFSTKSSRPLPEIAAKYTSEASLNTENAESPSALSHNMAFTSAPFQSMASSYMSTVVNPLVPLSHPDKTQEPHHPSANFDLLPRAELNTVIPADPPRPASQQKKAPPKRKPPASRKVAAPTAEKRITRAKRSKPFLPAMSFQASPLTRTHPMASSTGVRRYVSQGEASITEQEGASPKDINMATFPNSRMIHQPQAERASSAPSFLRPLTFPDVPTTLATLADHGGDHHQELAITNQAHLPKNPTPWFLRDAAPALALPAPQTSLFSTNPLSPLNRSLLHDLPQKVTCMYPVPSGLEASATQPADDIDNFERSIVTYRRLGLKFDEIAAKFHRGGFAADVVTATAVEQSWRDSEDKDFCPWYGDDVLKLNVFEMDDPSYL
ncbi:MAG: hypothetical protein LQ349_003071 [Xanthoria aureola]|nr:MAG: hypothetical protein LQ349_003071 [Xanthoria aureola]